MDDTSEKTWPATRPAWMGENDAARRVAFLSGVRCAGTIAEGCRRAGRNRATWRDTWSKDPEFVVAFHDALQDYRDSLHAEATRRGRDGWQEPVIYQGALMLARNPDGTLKLDDDLNPVPLTITKVSDRLLELQLRALDTRYREKASLEVTGANGGPVDSTLRVVFVEPGGPGAPGVPAVPGGPGVPGVPAVPGGPGVPAVPGGPDPLDD
jgi:hypothetical protein